MKVQWSVYFGVTSDLESMHGRTGHEPKSTIRGARGVPIEPADARVPVLLVDDMPANLVVLEAVLSTENYELRTAHCGRDAIREVEQHDFAVVLLDVQMPEMDGFETAAQLKEIGRDGGPVPVIFVTGMGGDSSRVLRAYAEGAVDFIEKPLVREVVCAKVAVFAALYRARRRLRLEQQKAARAVRMLTDLAVALSETANRPRWPQSSSTREPARRRRIPARCTC